MGLNGTAIGRYKRMRNKRNYYRILHVQFDAPPAVIKASYRAIMQKLGAHPDLGGEEWNASLINEARDVLLDPVLRAEYDLQLDTAGSETGSAAAPNSNRKQSQSDVGGRPNHDPSSSEKTRATNTDSDAEHHADSAASQKVDALFFEPPPACPFCSSPIAQRPATLQQYPTAHRCTQCQAPLKNVDKLWLKKHNELRKIHRSELDQAVQVWSKWPRDSGYNATVCDWSTAGCCIQMNSVLNVDAVVLVLSPVFDATAIVRYQTAESFYGLEFVTLEVKMKPGSIFVSAA